MIIVLWIKSFIYFKTITNFWILVTLRQTAEPGWHSHTCRYITMVNDIHDSIYCSVFRQIIYWFDKLKSKYSTRFLILNAAKKCLLIIRNINILTLINMSITIYSGVNKRVQKGGLWFKIDPGLRRPNNHGRSPSGHAKRK